MNDDRIHLFLRVTKNNRPLSLKIQSIVTEPMLHNISQACSQFQHPQVFSALYSFLFFSFLRLSNVLLHSTHNFDPSRLGFSISQLFGTGWVVILAGGYPGTRSDGR